MCEEEEKMDNVQDMYCDVSVESNNDNVIEMRNAMEEITCDDAHLGEPDDENVTDTVNTMASKTNTIVPEVGMIFKDENEMFQLYKKYAYAIGFPVKKRNSKKGDNGVLRYLTFTCSREGRRCSDTSSSLKPQPTIRVGCKARMSASSDIHGIWRINTVYLDHNHEISPSKARLYRCNRELTTHVKRKLQVNDLAGIPLHKSYNSAVVEAGGYEKMTCIEKDCRNYIEKVRRLRLGEGDAAAIQSYFAKMQAQCSGFYFSMDLDDDSRLRNIFWADNRCRQSYKEFGDVITFDTTYLTNKYDMPFAHFVGVNHHGQSILLGCGLLANEDTNTFVWLFKAWLQCMQGQAPMGIITDQDRAMQNAIQHVFPNTRHRWCLWHIMKKLPEKFGYHADKSSIFRAIHELVYDSQSPQEFEGSWRLMVETFGLHNNDWLSGLYDNRCRWVPCFLKNMFWAGMSTTQRSESMNAFFDGYVHSKTSLKQFVEQYERALRSKVEKEFQADFKSFSQMVPCATQFDMEKQFQAVYTISKFREVQAEFTGKVYCDIISTVDGCPGTRHEVRELVTYEGFQTKKTFFVSFEKEQCDVSCSCHLFEFRGIICRHAIAVLNRNDVTRLPERYILSRWRRDISRSHMRVAVNYDGLETTVEQLRYDEMCQAFAQVADLVAHDDRWSSSIMDWIQTQHRLLISAKASGGSTQFSPHVAQLPNAFTDSHNTSTTNIQDPTCTRRKGAPRKLRRKSPLESNSKKSKACSRSSIGKQRESRQSNVQEIATRFEPTQQQAYSTSQAFPLSQPVIPTQSSTFCPP